VPLNKLSLGDIRYIESVIKSAEESIGGRAEGMPIPSAETPPPETKPQPAAKRDDAVSPRSVRYRWTKDQSFEYVTRERPGAAVAKSPVMLFSSPLHLQPLP
jgi:hypothetical protein